MKFCTKCGKELFDEAVVCPNCGCATGNTQNTYRNPYVQTLDEVSGGLCFLSFLIPLFGIIYWAVKYRETPKRAQACGVTALISWAIGIVFSIIYSAVILTI